MYFILPAGYLGSSLFGMLFVVCSARALAAQIMSGVLSGALLLVGIVFADNCLLRELCLFYAVCIAGAWAVQIKTEVALLQYFLLFTGVMNGFFAIYDIYDDLIARTHHQSDAKLFAELTKTSSKCWGVIWFFLSLIFMAIGIFGNLKLSEV